ncbi:hypothetical protein D1867_11575 [Acidianus infernus]|uniref:Uncharacterized protein n=1 Tax=Acidianus infernus TaxID=12915 RepID=A0A6A9QFD9_ACIIN|nr:hypothetical protein [Acidianus infernus]MCY0874515.1 hypothetical protein [Acidianus infernus]MUM65861.1 hypothetical protein [Acidianus infernus]
MSEELLKPGEREMIQSRSYLYDLIDKLNDILENKKEILEQKGIAAKLSVTLELITLNRLYLDVIYKTYWNQLLEVINELNAIPELKDDMVDVNADVEEIKKLKQQGGF